jgi:hypothetical protein
MRSSVSARQAPGEFIAESVLTSLAFARGSFGVIGPGSRARLISVGPRLEFIRPDTDATRSGSCYGSRGCGHVAASPATFSARSERRPPASYPVSQPGGPAASMMPTCVTCCCAPAYRHPLTSSADSQLTAQVGPARPAGRPPWPGAGGGGQRGRLMRVELASFVSDSRLTVIAAVGAHLQASQSACSVRESLRIRKVINAKSAYDNQNREPHKNRQQRP